MSIRARGGRATYQAVFRREQTPTSKNETRPGIPRSNSMTSGKFSQKWIFDGTLGGPDEGCTVVFLVIEARGIEH